MSLKIKPQLWIVGFSSFSVACSSGGPQVVETIASPGGQGVVQILRRVSHGPGNNAGSTIIRVKFPQAPDGRDIAVFNDNGRDQPEVVVRWTGPINLAIGFGKVDIGFQAIRIREISVSYERIDSQSGSRTGSIEG